MCGIAGYISTESFDASLLDLMHESIAYRGPDSFGSYLDVYDKDYQIGLTHRRLAILDLSPLGHQPMHFDDVIIVFNGEVYNFEEIRSNLEEKGYTFESHSDTEVILKAYKEYGIDFIHQLNGMFAIALYDGTTKDFYLIRDRAGVKPLYYYKSEKGMVFGSELKPIMKHPHFVKELDRHALSLFLFHGYITAPHTIFKNTYKLEPGTFLHFKKGEIKIKTYWSVEKSFEKRSVQEKTEQEWLDELDSLLTDSVRKRVISDVPIGSFLSGGIDSSLISAIMQKVSKDPIKTFTIGFDHKDYNEAEYAKKVAHHLGTEHTEEYLSLDKVKALIQVLPTYYDEPFADSSQLPTMLLSQMTRKHVTVALSGDGGDELFCGYGRYEDILRLRKFSPFAKVANQIPFFKESIRRTTINSKYTQFFELTNDHNIINSAYLNYLCTRHLIKDYKSHFDTRYEDIMYISGNFQEKHMLQDLITYLPDDILTKVDRASMTYSLEVRAPMVDDHRLIELSFNMPHYMKYKDGDKKYILKKLLECYLPKNLIDRPKMGFGVPIYDWLKTDLRHFIDTYLSEDFVRKQGIFNYDQVRSLKKSFFMDFSKTNPLAKKFKLHQDGMVNRIIWHLIVFQLWWSEYGR